MALSTSIDYRGLTASGAVLRVMSVVIINGPTDGDKSINVRYAVWASQTAYEAAEGPLFEEGLFINKSVNTTEFGQFVTKMRSVDEDAVSAAYVAIKQLADWSTATDVDLSDE